jgi:hypothetical protein
MLTGKWGGTALHWWAALHLICACEAGHLEQGGAQVFSDGQRVLILVLSETVKGP